jgi:hypothetical protein
MGEVAIEEFVLENARQLDVVFLAVGGDFSKEYAHKLSEGVSVYVYACLCVEYECPEGNALKPRRPLPAIPYPPGAVCHSDEPPPCLVLTRTARW